MPGGGWGWWDGQREGGGAPSCQTGSKCVEVFFAVLRVYVSKPARPRLRLAFIVRMNRSLCGRSRRTAMCVASRFQDDRFS